MVNEKQILWLIEISACVGVPEIPGRDGMPRVDTVFHQVDRKSGAKGDT
jgi:hypothetical protein